MHTDLMIYIGIMIVKKVNFYSFKSTYSHFSTRGMWKSIRISRNLGLHEICIKS